MILLGSLELKFPSSRIPGGVLEEVSWLLVSSTGPEIRSVRVASAHTFALSLGRERSRGSNIFRISSLWGRKTSGTDEKAEREKRRTKDRVVVVIVVVVVVVVVVVAVVVVVVGVVVMGRAPAICWQNAVLKC